MEINQNASVDPSQIDDARGSGGGGLGGRLGGIPIRRARAGSSSPSSRAAGAGRRRLRDQPVRRGGGDPGNAIATGCATGTAAHEDTDCRNALYVESIQSFWKTELPKAYGKTYEPSKTRFFSGQTDTGCGPADSGVGPFYCPRTTSSTSTSRSTTS